MIILVGLVVLGVVGFCLLDRIGTESLWGLVGLIASVASVVLLAANVIALTFGRAGDRSSIAQYHAFVRTVEAARAKGSVTEYERAAIQKDIADWNQKLANVKYWNETIYDIFTVDEYANLPEIR